jgi:hypothetical protein
LIDLREQVRLLLEDQERRLALRTRNIRATQEISRYAATQRNAQILMDEVVNLIVTLFPNIYHAQIFLMDEDNNYAVLRASTGKPGRQLLARGHRLARGSTSVIGQVTSQGRTLPPQTRQRVSSIVKMNFYRTPYQNWQSRCGLVIV